MPRVKRAAAAVAESKIKEAINEINRPEDDDVTTNPETDGIASFTHVDDTTAFTNDPAAAKENERNFHNEYLRKHKKQKKQKKCNDRDDDVNSSEEGKFDEHGIHDMPSCKSNLFSLSTTSDASLRTLLLQQSDSSLFSSMEASIISSSMKAQLTHERRRAARQFHSPGPMILSLQTYERMSLGSESSPMYSPIDAARLSFTPMANLPMTPLFGFGTAARQLRRRK